MKCPRVNASKPGKQKVLSTAAWFQIRDLRLRNGGLTVLVRKRTGNYVYSKHTRLQWRSQPADLVPLCKFQIIIMKNSFLIEIDCFHRQ
jgi:uncharacterized protein YqjF (DUF2071 family)